MLFLVSTLSAFHLLTLTIISNNITRSSRWPEPPIALTSPAILISNSNPFTHFTTASVYLPSIFNFMSSLSRIEVLIICFNSNFLIRVPFDFSISVFHERHTNASSRRRLRGEASERYGSCQKEMGIPCNFLIILSIMFAYFKVLQQISELIYLK